MCWDKGWETGAAGAGRLEDAGEGWLLPDEDERLRDEAPAALDAVGLDDVFEEEPAAADGLFCGGAAFGVPEFTAPESTGYTPYCEDDRDELTVLFWTGFSGMEQETVSSVSKNGSR